MSEAQNLPHPDSSEVTTVPYGIEDAKRQTYDLADAPVHYSNNEAGAWLDGYNHAKEEVLALIEHLAEKDAEIERLEKMIEWYKGNPMSDDEYEQFRQRFPRFLMRMRSAEADRDHYKAMAKWLAATLTFESYSPPLPYSYDVLAASDREKRVIDEWLKAASEAVKP